MTILKKSQYLNFFFLFIAVAFVLLKGTTGGDFDVFLDASRRLYNHENIYSSFSSGGFQWYYSPFFALILIPFCNTLIFSEELWSLLSLLLMYRSFTLIELFFDFSYFSTKQKKLWVWLCVIFSVQFVLNNITLIQITALLLWGILESLHQNDKGKPFLAGVILGFVSIIKLMPLLMLPYLFYRGHFKMLGYTILTFLALLILPGVFFGFDYNFFLIQNWILLINPNNSELVIAEVLGFHDLTSMFSVYLMPTNGELPYKQNFVSWSFSTVNTLVNVARIALLALSLYFFQSKPFVQENNKLKSFWEIAYFSFIIPLIMPHQNKYGFLLCCPLVCYLLYFYVVTFKKVNSLGYKIVFVIFVISMIVYSPFNGSDILGWHSYRVGQHFRILSFATLLLIPVAMYCSPKRFYNLISVT